MDKKKVLVNIFSNWTNFMAGILIAFFVSPIIVRNLGNENYGIWTLIISITGYFTVLDFGVNTAIVRYISMYTAKREIKNAIETYSTSFIFFIAIGTLILIVTTVFAYFFKDFFNIDALSRKYLFMVFFIAGTDLAFSLIFSVNQATLSGLQNFLEINIISISSLIIKNLLIVILLTNGFGLMSLAAVQLSTNLLKALFQYVIIRKNYKFLSFAWGGYNNSILVKIFSYSIYSFIISVALKVLFFTDSVVIGKFIRVSEVTFFAIPAMIVGYIEKIIWAVSAALIPVISSHDAVGEQKKNKDIYIYCSKYSLILSIPIVFVLFTNGANFISIWMGEEYGIRAAWVLKILIVGYAFSFPQMISQGILKGISKHKVLAYLLTAEAVANFIISIILVRSYGIEGVAVGTTLPLIIFNSIIPYYTCKVLKIDFKNYIRDCYFGPLSLVISFTILYYLFPVQVDNYLQFFSYALTVTLLTLIFSWKFILMTNHRDWILQRFKKMVL